MNLQDIGSKSVAEIRQIIADVPKLKAFVANVKASPLEPIAEKLYPGIVAIEDKALADLDVFSGAASEIAATLAILFPQPSA